MKQQQIYHYYLYLFDSEEPVYLDWVQGQKLAMLLVSGKASKFVLIDDDVKNISAIKDLVKVKKNIGDCFRELTPEEEASKKRFEDFKNKSIKLLE